MSSKPRFTMIGAAIAAAMTTTALTPMTARADTVLTGTIKSAAGEVLGGVMLAPGLADGITQPSWCDLR